MKRWSVLLFGIASYLLFVATISYLAGFIGGLLVPTTLDGPLTGSLTEAIIIDGLLVTLFGLQHSVMARPGFKQWWTRFIPQSIERSVYVLASNVVLSMMFWQWRPLGGVIWNLEHPTVRTAAWSLFAFGWLAVFVTTCLINHFDLFGLRQVWLYFRGRPYTHLPFVSPGPYRYVRHPLYIGWLMAFWATPTMSFSHLLFAVGMTAYILMAIPFEERDLVRGHRDYADYRRRVPMFIPRLSAMTPSTTLTLAQTPVPTSTQWEANLSVEKVAR